jgi:transcription termination/antitermination protein NusA
MENLNLTETFSEFKELKSIDRATMMSVLEDVFRSLLIKYYGSDQNFDIIINIDKGDFEIWRNREVVEDDALEDPNLQIKLSEAKKIDDDYNVGEEVTDEVKLADFGRRAILALRQNLTSRILELEKNNVYLKYKDRIGEIVTGDVYQVWKREILIIDNEGNELILPRAEQIPTDYFRKGDTIRAVVIKVEMKNNVPLIILSRTSPVFLERLFELEVPEIYDGLITIKKIVRVPGERAKVAVESYDDRIDPVGACVGMKGSRIHGIVRELKNENIDVINLPQITSLYFKIIEPCKISSIKILEDEKRAEVFLKPNEVSLAIGKGGLNIKLAGQLTGYEIDVFAILKEKMRKM